MSSLMAWIRSLLAKWFVSKPTAKVIPITRKEPESLERISPIKLDPTPWLTIAMREKGVKEIEGAKSNKRIEEYHRAVNLNVTDDVPWCAAFVGWCLEKAGYKSTNNAMARSYLRWGMPLDKPQYGCVCVFWRNHQGSTAGHVGFFIAEHGDQILVLGGNQNDQVCEKYYSKNQLLGYRWPKEEIT